MIRPRVVSYSVVYKLVRISRSFGSELPYSPVLAMFRVEKLDKTVEGIAIGALRVGLRGAGAGSVMLARHELMDSFGGHL